MDTTKFDLNEKARKRIDEAMKAQEITQEDIAEFMGMDRSNVSRMITGQRKIKLDELKKLGVFLRIYIKDILADALGVRVAAIGDLDDDADPQSKSRDFDQENDLDQNQKGYSNIHSYEPRLKGAIPEVDVAAGAGEGNVGETVVIHLGDETYSGHQVLGEWVMPANYLTHELHVVGTHTMVMKVIGDSMYPTYTPNDRVLIDLKHNEISADGVYVITDGFSPPQIKRITRVLFTSPPEVDIVSDNPSHDKQRVPLHMLKVIGRVAGRVSAQ